MKLLLNWEIKINIWNFPNRCSRWKRWAFLFSFLVFLNLKFFLIFRKAFIHFVQIQLKDKTFIYNKVSFVNVIGFLFK